MNADIERPSEASTGVVTTNGLSEPPPPMQAVKQVLFWVNVRPRRFRYPIAAKVK